MHERSWTNIDKTDWGPGPWQDEPDKIQWVDDDTGLDCLIVRNRTGALCGYIGIPRDHPWYGCAHNKHDLDVHGGLTFAGACDEDAPEGHGICHIPLPGRPDDIWWLGFDCGHAFDVLPGMEAYYRTNHPEWSSLSDRMNEYRDVAYVREQCANGAAWLAVVRGLSE